MGIFRLQGGGREARDRLVGRRPAPYDDIDSRDSFARALGFKAGRGRLAESRLHLRPLGGGPFEAALPIEAEDGGEDRGRPAEGQGET